MYYLWHEKCLQMYPKSCYVLSNISEVLWQLQMLFILYTARLHISKGIFAKCKPFWSDLRTTLRNERETAQKRVELSNQQL